MKRILLIGCSVLLLTAFGCKKSPSSGNTNTTNTNSTITNTIVVVNTDVTTNTEVTNVATRPDVTPTEQELQRLVSAFAERYGSYSNQSNYANLENLLLFMTNDFQDRTTQYILQQRAKHADTGVYYGITTRSLLTTTNAFEESHGTAQYTVTTSRTEAIGTTANTRDFRQDITLTLRKVDGAWKVDSAVWQQQQSVR